MKNKKVVYVVYPNSLKAVSMNTLAMSELLINQFIFSKNQKIRFHVNNRMQLIECNEPQIKITLYLLLKSGKLPDVKSQILKLLHKDSSSTQSLGILKFLIDSELIILRINEVKQGADFTWEVENLSK